MPLGSLTRESMDRSNIDKFIEKAGLSGELAAELRLLIEQRRFLEPAEVGEPGVPAAVARVSHCSLPEGATRIALDIVVTATIEKSMTTA